ncbi:hypothetical protein FRB95_008656 [Tulasnella sp. JGI-2019a]|nr:hypothetical protein FRB95_008656 [Tulasnella sp. JGI-2019a]
MLEALLLRTNEPLSVTDCLDKVFPVCHKLQDQLNQYVEASSGEETKLYTPFVVLANKALQQIKSINPSSTEDPDYDILFHVNHPEPISHRYNNIKGTRIPDVVVVTLTTALTAGDPDRVDEQWDEVAFIRAEGRPDKAFEWNDIRFALEFKPGNKQLGRPPTIFTTALPIFVKPRSIPVDFYDPEHVQGPETDLPTAPAAPKKLGQAATSGVHLRSRRSNAKYRSDSPHAGKGLSMGLGNKQIIFESAPPSHKKLKKTGHDPLKPITRRLDVTVQTALYGTEILSAPDGLATSSIAFAIIGDVIHLWWYDRQGAIQTTGLNFVQHLPYFLVLLFALQRIPPAHIQRVRRGQYMEMEIHRENSSPLELRLEPQKFHHYGMVGRATKVFPATSSSVDHRPSFDSGLGIPKGGTPAEASQTMHGLGLVVKLSHVQEGRIPEAEIISEAIHLAKAASDPKITDAILGHVPEVIATRDYPEYDTKHIRSDVGIKSEAKKENRRLRCLVLRRLRPITEVPAEEFLAVYWDCIMCHYALWCLGIHHRDISVSNLMFYVDKDGKCRGVLNDFDLATIHNRTDASGTERTGTLPFMAMDLLTKKGLDGKVPHLYRHDLEAFFWVLLWICCTFTGVDEVNPLPLIAWTYGPEACSWAKSLSITQSSTIPPPTTFHFDHWRLAGLRWWKFLSDETNARSFADLEISLSTEGKKDEEDNYEKHHQAWRDRLPCLESIVPRRGEERIP